MSNQSRECDTLKCGQSCMDNDCRTCIHVEWCLSELEPDDPFLEDDWMILPEAD